MIEFTKSDTFEPDRYEDEIWLRAALFGSVIQLLRRPVTRVELLKVGGFAFGLCVEEIDEALEGLVWGEYAEWTEEGLRAKQPLCAFVSAVVIGVNHARREWETLLRDEGESKLREES